MFNRGFDNLRVVNIRNQAYSVYVRALDKGYIVLSYLPDCDIVLSNQVFDRLLIVNIAGDGRCSGELCSQSLCICKGSTCYTESKLMRFTHAPESDHTDR